jgi:hypothetical protein
MMIKIIKDFTRALGAPRDWDPVAMDAKIAILPIRDHVDEKGVPSMISQWEITPAELEKLNKGADIFLRVLGTTHPPVGLWVGEPPE